MYDLPQRHNLFAMANQGGVPAAWIRTPVRFSSGETCAVRFVFVCSPADRESYPGRVEVLGRGSTPEILF